MAHWLYKEFDTKENFFLNVAAILGLCVALFPTPRDGSGIFTVHGFCAITMFLCLAYIVFFRTRDTLGLLEKKEGKEAAESYAKTYKLIGIILLTYPLVAFILNLFTTLEHNTFVFWMEAMGIWSFALCWRIKSSELKKACRREGCLGRTCCCTQLRCDDLILVEGKLLAVS